MLKQGEIGLPAHFVLKRFLEGFEEYGDLYEAIKSGRKTVEYRDASPYWEVRLLSLQGRVYFHTYESTISLWGENIKHDKAVFVVGYTKYPRLIADITKIVYNYDSDTFETHLENVREELGG